MNLTKPAKFLPIPIIILIYAVISAISFILSQLLFANAELIQGVWIVSLSCGCLYWLLLRQASFSAAREAEHRKSEESLTRVLAGSQLGFWDWNISTGEVKRNPIWAEMLGYTFDEIQFTTQQWTDFVHPDDRERAWSSINAVLTGHSQEHELTYRMRTKLGEYKWILDRARVVERDANGKPLRMSGTHSDVDKLKKTEAALQLSEKRFRSIFENAGVGIAQISPDGVFELINDTFCEITGYSREELLHTIKHSKQITFPADVENDGSIITQLLNGLGNKNHIEKRYIRKDGTIAWVHVSVSLLKDADEQPLSLIWGVHDITKLINLQQELELQAHIDYLTGVPSRRYFMELAEHELARAQRYNLPFAVIMIDIDHFKQINDHYGHKAGDQVLKSMAKLMQDSLREVDALGRIGGEEFAIILPQADKERALEVAERLHTAIARTEIQVNDITAVFITISLGVTVLNSQTVSLETLLNQADKGLYQAKSLGRDRIVFSPLPEISDL